MKDKAFIIIAVDGGAASGKSSTSQALAQRFHLLHVDTGAHYRALTFWLVQEGIEVSEESRVLEALSRLQLGYQIKAGRSVMTLDGCVLSDADLRSEAVNREISHFAALPQVRAFLKDYQRSQVQVAQEAGFKGLVMEGRDIGSVIFPDADFRFFLEADANTRAKRREEQGEVDSIVERDRLDSVRKMAPLHCPEGAMRIDTAQWTLDEVVQKISNVIHHGG